MGLFFCRQSPLPVPPSQGSLKFWLDAQDLSVPDGTIVTTMSNKGTLGGTFIDRSTISNPFGMGFDGQATATTVAGKRALSYDVNKSQSFISSENISAQTTITVLTITANQANKIPGDYVSYQNFGVHCSIGNQYGSFYIQNVEYPYQYGYQNHWCAANTEPLKIPTYIDSGDISAIVVQYDTTLVNPSTFNKIKKDAADFNTTINPELLSGIPGGPMVVGGFLALAGAGGQTYSFAGKIYEMLVWEGIVDVASIKAYLDQKYGGTW